MRDEQIIPSGWPSQRSGCSSSLGYIGGLFKAMTEATTSLAMVSMKGKQRTWTDREKSHHDASQKPYRPSSQVQPVACTSRRGGAVEEEERACTTHLSKLS